MPKPFELHGELRAVLAGRVGAVSDDRGGLVRQQFAGAVLDVSGDEVDGTGQVLLAVAGLGQRVDGSDGSGVEAGLQLVTGIVRITTETSCRVDRSRRTRLSSSDDPD